MKNRRPGAYGIAPKGEPINSKHLTFRTLGHALTAAHKRCARERRDYWVLDLQRQNGRVWLVFNEIEGDCDAKRNDLPDSKRRYSQ